MQAKTVNVISGTSMVLGVALVVAIGLHAKAEAVTAPGDITITRVGTDAMGGDSFQNRNREYVSFKNTTPTSTSVNVAGYTVMDEWRNANLANTGTCNKYKIGATLPGKTDALLEAGKSVTVFNGWGMNRATATGYVLFANSKFSCGLKGHYLNNDKDTAVLKTGDSASDTVVDSKSWNWNGGYFVQ